MGWTVKNTDSNSPISVNNTVNTDSAYPSAASTWISLNPGEICHLQISADFPGSPTDDLGWRVVTTLDDSNETADNVGLGPAGSIDKDDYDPTYSSFVMSGVYKFRVEFRKLGTASETVTVNLYYRRDNVNL